MKIIVTGAYGMLGSKLVISLRRNKYNKLYFKKSNQLNLMEAQSVIKYFKKIKPDVVYHCANKVYGIGGNYNNKYKMFRDNFIMNSNILSASEKFNVKKIIFISSSAVYPQKKGEIYEKDLINTMPHNAEFYYGISKKIMLEQLIHLKKKTGIKFKYLIMNNMYGENDNFNIKFGHVIPSLINKFYLAKKNNTNVKIWGSKNDKRCFMYSEDAAEAIRKVSNSKYEIANISSNREVKIIELVKILSNIFNYKKISWVQTKYKPVSRRKLNIKILKECGFKKEKSLEDGLKKTVEWVLYNQNIVKF